MTEPQMQQTDPRKSGLPKKLSPKMQQAVRLIMAGKSPKDVAKEMGLNVMYLRNVLKASVGAVEKDRLKSVIDLTFAEKMATEAAGGEPKSNSAIEVQEAELQAIQELRRIMVSSTSDVARAAAAKELLEISHLKQRLQSTLAKPSGEESTVISEKDLADFMRCIEDLQDISAGLCLRCKRNTVESDELPAPIQPTAEDAESGAEAPEGVAQSEADSPAISDNQGAA